MGGTAKAVARGLYAITDCEHLSGADLLARTRILLQTGIAALQYRDKRETDPARRAQAFALLQIARQYSTPFIVNDDIVLAKAIGAEGVHLGSEDITCREARRQLGAAALIGISCYDSIDLALEAQRAGADYVAFGAFFPTTTKVPRSSASPALLRRARPLLDLPIVAIGGLKPDNARPLLEAGADMLAASSSLYGAGDPAAVVAAFNALFDYTSNEPGHAR